MDKTQQIVASAPKLRKGRDDPFRSTEVAPPVVAAAEPAPTPPPAGPAPAAAAPKQKTESIYTETTTLPLSKEQKELIEDLGTKLQRQRVGPKKPELNWKSILRGMIGLLDEHTFDGVSVATEEELYKVIKNKFGR